MDLDLRQLMHVARRRWWIVALLMIVAGTSAYISSSRQTPVYSATATMLINPGLSPTSADYSTLLASERIAATYQQLVTTQPMRERVAEALGQEELTSGISTSAVEESQLINVTVTDTDPAEAARVANTVVAEFQEYIAEQTAERAETTRGGLDAQIAALEQRQQEIDERINELDTRENANDPAIQREITDLMRERTSIEEALMELNTNAITVDTQMTASSVQIQMVDPAQVPQAPFSPQPTRSLMLGLFVGALLGAGLVALLEFLDNTVKPEMNVQALAGAPLLATIASIPKLRPGGAQVYTLSQPQIGPSESMRLLRTNLEFASASEPIHSITVSSPSPAEGKSTTVANLGVVLAQSGLTTVIMDADLRKPTQNRIFGVDNSAGLTTLLMHPENSWETVAQKVALPGLFLIPSGPIPPNPSDLLTSSRFENLLEKIKADVDMLIIDSPPALSASDALAISQHTDGVILVCQSHKTRVETLRHAAASIRHGGIRLIGVVLNRQKGQKGASYYGEYYGTAPTPAPKPGD